MRSSTLVGVVAGALALSIVTDSTAEEIASGVSEDGTIQVPDVDYRKDWSYLGTFSVLGENGAAQLHVVYTQPETVATYRETGEYPDGAVLIKELFEGQSDDLTTGRASWAGDFAGWFVMVKDTEGRFPENPLWGDGWGWAFFEPGTPDETVTENYESDCLGCHEPARDTDLVYVQGYPAITAKGR